MKLISPIERELMHNIWCFQYFRKSICREMISIIGFRYYNFSGQLYASNISSKLYFEESSRYSIFKFVTFRDIPFFLITVRFFFFLWEQHTFIQYFFSQERRVYKILMSWTSRDIYNEDSACLKRESREMKVPMRRLPRFRTKKSNFNNEVKQRQQCKCQLDKST